MASGQQRKIERRREVIRLRRQGLSNGEIAAELGVTQAVVGTLLYRARQEGMKVPVAPYWNRGRSR